jgi:hypothetical protein
MIVSGVLGLLYSLAYFAWTLIPLAWGTFGVIAILEDKGVGNDLAGAMVMFFATPALQCAAYAVCVVTGVITLFAGVRFNQHRSLGLVWLGVLCSTATPVLGVFATSASMLNCGSLGAGLLGCLFGNVGTVPLLVIGLIASVWGIAVLSDPTYAARFDAEPS